MNPSRHLSHVASTLRGVNGHDPGSAAWPLVVRPVTTTDRPAVDAYLTSQHADVVARLGEVVDARACEALLAECDGALAGVATIVVRGEELEVLPLHAVEQWRGAGSALLAAAADVARTRGCRRMVRVHAGAVERSRARLKPSIPELGASGIAIRDELELELDVD
jgi:GNAT superfamily N-acetyltransferase